MTTRRTTKIAKPYTAALFRCYDKASGVCLGYLSPSEDASKAPYQVTCDDRGEWHCTCEGNARFHRKCQHIRAACELCAIRVKQGRPACRAASLPEPVAEKTAKPLISDEEMAAIAAAAHQAVDETPAAVEPARDLVAVAATNAAKAGPAIDKALIASEASSERRLTSTLSSRAGYVIPAPIAAPGTAVSRVPMR